VTKMEKLSYLVTPIANAVALLVIGTLIQYDSPKLPQGAMLLCTGLISVEVAVLMGLLIRLLDKSQ
jgi:hypothetical protein